MKSTMTPENAAMVAKYIQPDDYVLEYGSGGSTVAIAPRAARVLSIDHSEEWATKTREALIASGIKNAEVRLAAPPRGTKPIYRGVYTTAYGSAFKDYVAAGVNAGFDYTVVLIDGRARLACARAVLPQLPKGGIILFNNFLGADRSRYREFLKECQMVDCVVRGQTLAVFRK